MALLDAFPADLKPRLAWVNAPSPDLLSVILTDKTAITYGTSDSLPEKNYDLTTLLATGKPDRAKPELHERGSTINS